MQIPLRPTMRLLLPDDTLAFREIRLLALRTHPECFGASEEDEELFTSADWQRRVGSGDAENFVIGAFHGAELVGITGFFPEKQRKLRHKGAIWGVFVVPSARNKGVGRMLVSEALTVAERIPGLNVIQLSVAEENREALSLYRRLGFQEFGSEPYARMVNDIYISEVHMYRLVQRRGG